MSALRRVADHAASAAAAIALAFGLAGAAAAQTGLRIETIEPLGAWAKATVAGTALFVTAAPNTPAARAYCLSSYLKVPYDAIPHLGADAGAEAEKTGSSRAYACLRLACNRHGARNEIKVSVVANAAPDPGETGMPLGVVLRVRFAGEAPLALFARADVGQTSRDGALEMLNWEVSDRRQGADGSYAEVRIAFSAPYAFVDRLAEKQRVAFELGPGQDRQIAAFKHGARKMELGLARTADVAADLRRLCARPALERK